MEDGKIERLLIDDPYIGGFYVTLNVDLIKASRKKHKLTYFENSLLYDICSYWESNTRYHKAHTPLKASLREFAIEYDVSKTTMKEALTTLLDGDLIKRENNGKETSKYAYYPNVRVLKENLTKYVEQTKKKANCETVKKSVPITGTNCTKKWYRSKETVPKSDTDRDEKRLSVPKNDTDFAHRQDDKQLRTRGERKIKVRR
jgi:CTP-dependent riboflavin kinase